MIGVASTKTDFEPATADTSPLIARARTDAAGPRSVIGMAEQLSWLGIALMVIICVHLLRCFGRRLRQGRGARCRAGGKKTYRHGPVSGKLFSGYFLEIFLRIKHGPKGLRRCLHQTEDVLAVLRQLALPDAVDPEQTLRCGGAGLRDRLQGQVREHDVRRPLLLPGALPPPPPNSPPAAPPPRHSRSRSNSASSYDAGQSAHLPTLRSAVEPRVLPQVR